MENIFNEVEQSAMEYLKESYSIYRMLKQGQGKSTPERIAHFAGRVVAMRNVVLYMSIQKTGKKIDLSEFTLDSEDNEQ